MIIAATLSSCSDGTQTPEEGADGQSSASEANVTIIPEAKIETPGVEWVGTLTEYAAIFSEDLLAKGGAATDLPRLFVRLNKAPYTGSITRVFQDGAVEFMGKYVDGYLDGLVRQWARDGSMISSIRAKRGQILEENISDSSEPPAPILLAPTEGEGVVSEAPIFIGSNEALSEWTTFSEDGDFLIDKRTGKKVSGGIKVYDKNGKLSYFSQYKAGKLHGREEKSHANGQKMTDIQYADGVKHGVEIWWDEEGYK